MIYLNKHNWSEIRISLDFGGTILELLSNLHCYLLLLSSWFLLNEYIENWKIDGYDVLYTAVRLIVCPDSGTKLRKRLLFPSDQWSK